METFTCDQMHIYTGSLNIEINMCIAEDNMLILTPRLGESQSSWQHIKRIKYAMQGETFSQFPPKIHPENRVLQGVTPSFLKRSGSMRINTFWV